jgi:hypothetical protein
MNKEVKTILIILSLLTLIVLIFLGFKYFNLTGKATSDNPKQNLLEIDIPVEELESQEIKNPVLGYYFSGKNKIDIFDEEKRLFVYYPKENYWEESEVLSGDYFNQEKNQWCNLNECGVLPKNLEILSGYSFKSGDVERVNIFGKVDGEVVLMVYNGNLWFDRTNSEMSGENGKLPRNFEPDMGFYNKLSNEIWIFGNNKVYVYSFSESKWEDKTSLIGNKIPLNRKWVLGYWHPFGGDNGIINLFDVEGNLYYTTDGNTFGKMVPTHRNFANLPREGDKFKVPNVGYYDEINEKVVLIYENGESYTRDSGAFVKDDKYLSGLRLEEEFSSIEEINSRLNYSSYWNIYGNEVPDLEKCGNEQVRYICFYDSSKEFSLCKETLEYYLIDYLETGECDKNEGLNIFEIYEDLLGEENMEELDLVLSLGEIPFFGEFYEEEIYEYSKGAIKCEEIEWKIMSFNEFKKIDESKSNILDLFDYSEEGNILGDLDGDGIINKVDEILLSIVLTGKIEIEGDYCKYDLNMDGKINSEDLNVLSYFVENKIYLDFKCSDEKKVIIGSLNQCKGRKICGGEYETNCIA